MHPTAKAPVCGPVNFVITLKVVEVCRLLSGDDGFNEWFDVWAPGASGKRFLMPDSGQK